MAKYDMFGEVVEKPLYKVHSSPVYQYLVVNGPASMQSPPTASATLPVSTVSNAVTNNGNHAFQFQEEGIAFILNQIMVKGENVLLADEMGVGKTIQYLLAVKRAKPESVLIVVPKNLALNTLDEAQKWCGSEVGFEWEFCLGAWEGSPFTITTYENLKSWGRAWAKRNRFKWVIFDEAQLLKNTQIQRYRGMMDFVVGSSELSIIHVSGTPIMNYPNELYPVILPLILDRETTRNGKGYYVVNEKYGKQMSTIDIFTDRYMRSDGRAKRAEELNHFLYSTFAIRRLKKDVMSFLPPRRRSVVKLKPTPELELLIQQEKELQKKSETDFATLLQSDEAMTNEEWEALVNVLETGGKIPIGEMARLRHLIALAKLPLCYEHIDQLLENEGEKFVIFGHHKDVMENMAEHVRAVCGNDDAAFVVDGDTPLHARHAMVKKFQDRDSSTRILVLGMKIASLGLTLTASSHVVFIEGDWVPSILSQAEARVHRYGVDLDRKIIVQHLVVEGTLDATMAQRCVYKQRQQDAILDREVKK